MKKLKDLLDYLILFMGFILFLYFLYLPLKSYWSTQEQSVLINKTERVCSSSTEGWVSCKYLVFTDKGVFKNTDSILIWKFNSSDIYGEISKGDKMKIKYYGWRVPFFSIYPNIKSVQKED